MKPNSIPLALAVGGFIGWLLLVAIVEGFTKRRIGGLFVDWRFLIFFSVSFIEQRERIPNSIILALAVGGLIGWLLSVALAEGLTKRRIGGLFVDCRFLIVFGASGRGDGKRFLQSSWWLMVSFSPAHFFGASGGIPDFGHIEVAK